MLYPASATAPEVDVRKLVCVVEDVWHDNGPRLAQPLRRGSLAAVLRNPYAGRYVADARIVRAPASTVRDDSDLGDRLVVRAVPPLPRSLVDAALARGAAEARVQIDSGRIIAAVLSLQGRWRVVGEVGAAAGLEVDGAGSTTPDPRLRDERAAVR